LALLEGEAVDAAALRAFHATLEGDRWQEYGIPVGWDLSGTLDRLDTLKGVTTDEEGRVVELFLHGVGLRGQLPPSISTLSKLTRLYLGGNAELTGPLPASLADIPSLTELWVNNTSLEGEVPAALLAKEGLSLHIDGSRLESNVV